MFVSTATDLEARTRVYWEISLQWNDRIEVKRGQEISASDAIHDLRYLSEAATPGRPIKPQALALLKAVILGYASPSSVPAKVHQLRRGLIA